MFSCFMEIHVFLSLLLGKSWVGSVVTLSLGGNGSFLCILSLNNKRILNELERKHGDNVVGAWGRSYRAAGERRGMEEEKGWAFCNEIQEMTAWRKGEGVRKRDRKKREGGTSLSKSRTSDPKVPRDGSCGNGCIKGGFGDG